ncbi:hypothetical protein BJ165DRAFT_1529636 [Panaeolus papilionaceus]|nr:hypothetical protein BJ165DRAFT_1529636 [Panaeolus papilionaceus]
MTKLFTLVFTALLASYVAANPENVAREAAPEVIQARSETLKETFLRKWIGEKHVVAKREPEPETLKENFLRKWLNGDS